MSFEIGQRYRARPTNRVMPVGMNYLSDLIIRPGIEKRLWPLLTYRGGMTRGRAHRLWNMALLMMAAECETLSDGLKVLNNPSFAQLCGPVRAPVKCTLANFFGRMWSDPHTTDNIPGLTEYVKSMGLGPCSLQPVELETDRKYCAEWRISTHHDFDSQEEKPESGVRNLYYPFLAHNPKKADDGKALVLLANQLVPEFLPDMIRADICQELIVGILAGDVVPERADDFVVGILRRVYRMYPSLQRPEYKGAHASIDQPINSRGGRDGSDPIPWAERH